MQGASQDISTASHDNVGAGGLVAKLLMDTVSLTIKSTSSTRASSAQICSAGTSTMSLEGMRSLADHEVCSDPVTLTASSMTLFSGWCLNTILIVVLTAANNLHPKPFV